MPVTSVNISRISNNMQTTTLLETLRRNTLNLFLEQNRVASGNKFTAPSEDPVGASRALKLTEILEQQEQVLANIQHADSFLSVTDSAVGEVNDLLGQAYSIASEMVNSTADDSQRLSMSELVRGIIGQLVTVGNRTYQGVQLFGGQETTTSPFTQSTGGVEYGGDTGGLTAHVDYQQNPIFNVNGSDLFGMLSSRISGYVDLDPVITADTRLADLDGAAGLGVEPSLMRVTLNQPPTTFTVDLSQADTAGDVVDYVNAAAAKAGLNVGAGGDFNASIKADGTGLSLAVGAGTLSVAEVGEGVTARDLGLVAMASPGIEGRDLQARLTTTTSIESLFGGAGANLGSILIRNGNNSATVDLSGAETVGELLNRINASSMGVQAQINDAGTGIDVINRVSGLRMSIGEAGGNTASLLGIRSMHADTSLSSLNDGAGVGTVAGMADFRITARDGTSFDVSLDGSETIADVLDAINTAASTAGVNFTASLATTGNGIRLVDGTGGSGLLQVSRLNASSAVDDLGLLGHESDGASELISSDVATVRTNSVFTALYELYDALTATNPSHIQEQQITGAAETIHSFMDNATQLQGIVGARSQAMTSRLQMTEDAVTSSRALLSQVKDLDYTEAITKFQQAQTALQGNLMTGPRLLQMSLLNFLG